MSRASVQRRRRTTFTATRRSHIEEPLIFEIGRTDTTGVDLPEPAKFSAAPRQACAHGADRPARPRPSPRRCATTCACRQKNYAIDTGLFPLGSCTMKHNPRLNEKMARLPGFGDIHPLQPLSTVPGALALIAELSRWLCELTGMPAVAMTPKAGAHGELCGMMAIKAALEARGEKRSIVLVPESAHGTNPATAALLGYRVETVPARADGTVDPEEVKKQLSPDVAAIMLTNPNTCGLFERDVVAIAEAVHAAGAYFYADGANFNAIVGKVRPGDLGVDAMHINLHKTFSTPHGGGGPGAGRWRCRRRWRRSCRCRTRSSTPTAVATWSMPQARVRRQPARPHVRLPRPDGHVRARAGLHAEPRLATACGRRREDAVLNANYVRASLADLMSLPFGDRPCMHEVLFDDHWLEGTGVTTLDFAKAMIDEGYPPDDHVFPAGRARRHADRADRIGIQAKPRPVHRLAARAWPRQPRPATRRASRTRRALRRAAASTRPRPRASRGCAGSRRPCKRRRRSRTPLQGAILENSGILADQRDGGDKSRVLHSGVGPCGGAALFRRS